jgi:hypothetical protein
VINRKELLKDLQRQVHRLEDDLREQAAELDEVHARLRAEYDRAFKLGRTAATWTAWRDDRVTQAAVAWVLGTVFVRFCEDNGLLASPYLAGPSAERMTLAEEAQEQFFRDRQSETDRGWLLASFDAIRVAQAGDFLFSQRHNPLYQIPVSHDAAKSLIAFWRRRGEDGKLVHDFTDPAWDTRFLGDLYQDLSESARKTYALLQTPEFVEEFILDHTLTPAIDEFGYDIVKLIDPTCGSGHFLLGAFHRLLNEWEQHSPARDPQERVRLTLEAIHGVDINPFAVAIARFRLLIESLRAAGFSGLTEASGYSFPINIAVGDSLIKARQLAFEDIGDELAQFQYATEDVLEFPGMLEPSRYHVIVGNPPYITVKDKKLNQLYRELYDTCSGTYALSVPFAQRFFELARPANVDGRGSGHIGQITASSFMKRDFGKKLIEQFFANQVELTHVIDASGIPISGHGTPPIIIFGRRKSPSRARAIRAVMGIRGEPGTPDDPSQGFVWQAILNQLERGASESEWISVTDLPRDRLASHPWSISGGGVSDLAQIIEERAVDRMAARIDSPIGRAIRAGADESFMRPLRKTLHTRADPQALRPLMIGEIVRDWLAIPQDAIWYPYHPSVSGNGLVSELWPWRRLLEERRTFHGNMADAGLKWWDYMQHTGSAYSTQLSITFAFVSTHDHFVLDRGGKVFKQSAPVIKLPAGASEDEHLRLLGVLNSSTACFWLKQVSHKKGGSAGSGGGEADQPWSWSYEFTGTNLENFPLPKEHPLELARQLNALAQQLTAVSPATVAAEGTPSRERLSDARQEWGATRGRMIALQEELDWEVYSLYELLSDELTAPAESVPDLKLGERAFEIVLARKMAAGEVETQWFARHGSRPTTEIPEHWPTEYRVVVEKRMGVIESNHHIALIERPECKRRWATEGWDAMETRALREWLLDRCEARDLWFHHADGMEQPRLLTTSQLADELRRDPDVVAVAELRYPGKDLGAVVAELVADEHVPHLAALRYKDSGLQKRADWELTWDLQRQEDAAPTEEEKRKIRDSIPVPPKYGSGDFLRTSYWRNRGKLDVPKERFISYPHACRDGDPALLLGWAGWDHREQAQALATLVVEREQGDGWGTDRLAPLLAGLREVLPWVRQWHGEFHAAYGGSPAEVYAGFLADYQNRLHLTDQDLAAWRPPKAYRGRGRA